MTGVVCDVCEIQATDNAQKYYLVRVTNSGKDFDDGLVDYCLCGSCLLSKLDTPVNRGRIQSILRIENPMMG